MLTDLVIFVKKNIYNRGFIMRYGDRIREIRKYLGESQSKFSSKLGVSPMFLSRIETGERDIKIDLLSKMDNLGINTDWLITGEGEMFRSEKNTEIIIENIVKIPIIDVRASAGPGVINYMEEIVEYIAIPKDLIPIHSNQKNLAILEVYGDSMEPTLKNGERIIVDTRSTDIISGGIYLIRCGDELRIKRLERKINGNIKIFSDNPAFESEELTKNEWDTSEVHVLGLMIMSFRAYSTQFVNYKGFIN